MYEDFCRKNNDLVRGLSWRFLYICERDIAIDRDDLIQEGFLALIEAAKSYTGTDDRWGQYACAAIRNHFLTMLKLQPVSGLSRNVIIDAISLDKPVLDDDDTSLSDAIPDFSIRPFDETILDDEMSLALRAAVNMLDFREKQIVEWLYFDNLSIQNIANRLSIPYDSVRKTRDRAFAKLRRDVRLADYRPVNHKATGKRRGYI